MSAKASFVVGLQYGDEGKGKIVDLLADTHAVIVRANGGSNAGHTIVLENNQKLALHQLPSGVAYRGKQNVIAHGIFLDPVRLVAEMGEASDRGVDVTHENLKISTMCHLVMPAHKARDAAREASAKGQGSTKAGIAYVASDKALREGVRAEAIMRLDQQELADIARAQLKDLVSEPEASDLADEFAAAATLLKPYLCDTVALLQQALTDGQQVLLEGAQAFGLDVNHGKYPYTTSSDTTVPGLIVGSGVNHKQAGTVYGVVKAIPSKVGGGAFVTRIEDADIAESSRGMKGEVDAEYGATTGREREVGYLDLVALKRAIEINGVDKIAMTKFDCLMRHGEQTKVAVAYEMTDENGSVSQITEPPVSNEALEHCKPVYKTFATWGDVSGIDDYAALPEPAKQYVTFIEEYLGTPISIIGVGPERQQTIIR